MKDKALGQIAYFMAQYLEHVYRVRSINVMSTSVPSPDMEEFLNLYRRKMNIYDLSERAEQVAGLSSMAHAAHKEINALVAAADAGEKDPHEALAEAQQLQKQIAAANAMMEMLNG